MKKFSLFFFLLSIFFSLTNAQIPNASFESWTGGNPDQWFTGNSPGTVFVTQSTNAHAGSFAAQCNVISEFGLALSAPFALGTMGSGVHTSTVPQAVHGWYILNSIGQDFVFASAGMFNSSGGTGAGLETLTGTSVYKEFVVNVNYLSGVPNGDSVTIAFLFSNDSSLTLHAGSSFIVDDLSFGALSGIDDLTAQSPTALESVSPNPCIDEAAIFYHINSPGKTQLNIYDMSGRLVQQLANEEQGTGHYKAIADLSSVPEGIYFCKLVSGSSSDFLKLEIQR